jgi:hypothetical protein
MSPSLKAGPHARRRPERGRVPRRLQSRGRFLRSRCACLGACSPGGRASGRAVSRQPAATVRSAHAFHTGGQR